MAGQKSEAVRAVEAAWAASDEAETRRLLQLLVDRSRCAGRQVVDEIACDELARRRP